MSRVIAVAACGFLLAACSMSMPSLDIFHATPPTEKLRLESEPPGADARTARGDTCRTPCELTVPSNAELAITFELNGYQPLMIPVRPTTPAPAVGGQPSGTAHLQPNPVYAELQPLAPPRPVHKHRKRRAPAKKKPIAQRVAPAHNQRPTQTPTERPTPPAHAATPAEPSTSPPAPAMPAMPAPSSKPSATSYPWPPPPQ